MFSLETGTTLGETITGNSSFFNLLYGGDGDDTVSGTNAVLNALIGNAGNDTLNGVATAFNQFWGAEGDDTINGSVGAQDEAAYLGSIDEFQISFDDTNVIITDMVSSANPDVLTNLAGFDEGTDTLTNVELLNFDWGQTQFGLQTGSAGADTLNGTSGNDLMFGGSGIDTFVVDELNVNDLIADYTFDDSNSSDLDPENSDLVDLTGLFDLTDLGLLPTDTTELDTFVQYDAGVLSVDTDGALNGTNFVDAVTIESSAGINPVNVTIIVDDGTNDATVTIV